MEAARKGCPFVKPTKGRPPDLTPEEEKRVTEVITRSRGTGRGEGSDSEDARLKVGRSSDPPGSIQGIISRDAPEVLRSTPSGLRASELRMLLFKIYFVRRQALVQI